MEGGAKATGLEKEEQKEDKQLLLLKKMSNEGVAGGVTADKEEEK